jgi:protease-4
MSRAGVEAESLSRREFKSAADTFTRDNLSEPNRMQLTALLDALHDTLVQAIATGRGRTEDEAKAIVDRGMFRATDAKAAGLIDDIAYDDEIAERLGTKPDRMIPAGRYLGASRAWALRAFGGRRGARVGVVEVRGAIVTDAAVSLGRVADVRSVVGALRAARANPAIASVVLFVDSPGGSALASDLMAREVERLAEKKPVVAYFSNTAASGGYYVAALANEIVAQPVSITGSIGVVALRFVFEQTLEKLGLRHEVIRRGDHADIMSPYRHWTTEERELFDKEIDGAYRDFVAIVARGRKRATDEIEPLARGRVYAGKDAHALGLVDRLGGLRLALDRASELGKVPTSREPVLVHAPRTLPEPAEPRSPIEPIAAQLGLSMDMIHLALASRRERLFAFEDRIAGLSE